jgi:hypothetical protein
MRGQHLQDKADLASRRLEQLWQQVEKRWERENAGLPPPSSPGWQLSDGAGVTTLHAVGLAYMRTSDRPVWDETTLAIAEAVRQGLPVARLALPGSFHNRGRSAVADWLNRLQGDYAVIKLELADESVQRAVEECQEKDGQRLMEMGRKLLQKRIGGETLYAALDAYRKWVESQWTADGQLSGWGGAQLRQIRFLRQQLPNCPLDELDGDRIDELVRTVQQRPMRKNKERISASFARNCLKQLKNFFRWLHKSQPFSWRWPADF